MKNNLFSVIVASFMLATSFSYGGITANALRGDVSGDGLVDSIDASQVLIEYTLLSTDGTSSFTESQKTSADVNGDGYIDSIDSSMILIYYSNISTGGEPSWDFITPSAPDYSSYAEAVKLLSEVAPSSKYYIYDLDNNGVYELITLTDDEWNIYSIEDGEMVFLDNRNPFENNVPMFYYCNDLTGINSLMSGEYIPVIPEPIPTIDEWTKAYKKKINSLAVSNTFSSNDYMYDLVDIDGDTVPELIVSPGTYHLAGCNVYVYSDGNYIPEESGNSFGQNGIMGIDNENHVIRSYYYGQGYEIFSFWKLEGNKLTEIASFSTNEINGGNDYTYNGQNVTQAQYKAYRSQYNYTFKQCGRKYLYTSENLFSVNSKGLFLADTSLIGKSYSELKGIFGDSLKTPNDFPYWGKDLRNSDLTWNNLSLCFMFQYDKLVMIIYDTFTPYNSTAFNSGVSYYGNGSDGIINVNDDCYYEMAEDFYLETGQDVLHQRYISNNMIS